MTTADHRHTKIRRHELDRLISLPHNINLLLVNLHIRIHKQPIPVSLRIILIRFIQDLHLHVIVYATHLLLVLVNQVFLSLLDHLHPRTQTHLAILIKYQKLNDALDFYRGFAGIRRVH